MLETLYKSGWFLRVAAQYVGDRNDTEDVAQDAALRCWSWHRTCEAGRERAYFRKVTRTCACNHYRAKRRSPRIAEILGPDRPVSGEAEMINERLDRDALLQRVDGLIERLPSKERNAVRARRNGMSYREIAIADRVPEQTIRQRFRRGIKALRQMIDGRLLN